MLPGSLSGGFSWRLDLLIGAALALLYPLIALRRMVLDGFTRIPGDLVDGRLMPLFLEHSWLWLTRQPHHLDLWGLPFFYPAGDNALAFSDAMLGYAPLYWPWRALGLAPDTSYQMWLLAAFAASAAAGYAFFRALGLSPLAAAPACWLAAFSASRLHHVSHPQLLPLFYLFLALGAAALYPRLASRKRRVWAAAVMAGAVVAQLYSGFYLGFFLVLALGLVIVLALILPRPRRALLPRLRQDLTVWLLVAAVGAGALLPWLAHYRAAHELTGARKWSDVRRWVPRPGSWVYVTPRALVYRRLGVARVQTHLGDRFEHAVGLGWLTTAAALAAALAGRRDPRVQLAAGAALALMAATTTLGGGWEPWRWLVTAVPPLGAARAIVRVGLLLPIAAALCLACWADRARGLRRSLLLALLLLAGIEQLARMGSRHKEQQRAREAYIAERVDLTADAFYAVRKGRYPPPPLLHVDAMWASVRSGVPTVNGHSGVLPPDWGALRPARFRTPQERDAALRAWLAQRGRPGARVQVIEIPRRARAGGPG
jgi:hypothetical protein